MWPEFAAVALIGAMFFAGALLRFRKTVTLMQVWPQSWVAGNDDTIADNLFVNHGTGILFQ